ncbi:MAG: vWA domain-containing protein [Candidatus Binataceae bacterium]
MGLFTPINLLWGLSLAVLVAIYLRARSRPTIDVSSLMLFDEIPAPVARSRVLRVDPLFWLELAALAALSLALAGFYVYGTAPVGKHRVHALVFDLGAGMSAADNGGTRLDQARRQALELASAAPAGDKFSVISYALQARMRMGPSASKDVVDAALKALAPAAVAVRAPALSAALMRARGSDTIDLFTDHAPPAGLIHDADLPVQVAIHGVGAPAANLAIVSLDTGTPKNSLGRCVIRNFSYHPQQCELMIDVAGKPLFHSGFIVEPRAQLIVPFGPLPSGGLVHAQIQTPDALAADNSRYAYARQITPATALVVSPDAGVRDDLARIVLAINPDFRVTAMDPINFKPTRQTYDLAVIHDTSGSGIKAKAKLYVFPEPWLEHSKEPRPLLPVVGTVALAELRQRKGVGALTNPVLLGPARVVAMPGWMETTARGAEAGEQASFALAGYGRNRRGEVGLLAFDVRDHLLLDPDRLDALLLAVNTIQHLIAPQNLKIVSSGDYVQLTTGAPARLLSPTGAVTRLRPDEWGRVRFRPLDAGLYRVEAPGRNIAVYSNYYDAAESDLSGASVKTMKPPPKSSVAFGSAGHAEPISGVLIALALAFLLLESALMARHSARFGVRHV